MPKSALRAPLHQTLALLAGATALFLGIGGLVATGSRSAADTAHRLADAAAKIGRGVRVSIPPSPVHEADIVGKALASASNDLADQREAIVKSQDELESQVEDRTRALAQSRSIYQILANNVSDVTVMRWRGRSLFSYVSPSCLAVFGRDPETIQTLGLADLLHSEDASIKAIDDALVAARNKVTRQFRVRRNSRDRRRDAPVKPFQYRVR